MTMNLVQLTAKVNQLEKRINCVKCNFRNLPEYADNSAALAGGLDVGDLYRTATGDVKIVYAIATTTTTTSTTTLP